jgi:signal peptidase II
MINSGQRTADSEQRIADTARCTLNAERCNVRRPSSVTRHLIFWPVFIGGVILDLWSKSAVFGWLESRGQDDLAIIDGFLHLHLALNPGAAFGIAAGQRWLLITVSIAAVIAVVVLFLFSGRASLLIHITLGLFAAGVCGNLYDRLFNDGLVRDFIDVVYWPGRHWPAFNVADSLLCIAVGLLILSSIFNPKSCQKPAQQQK